MPNWYVQQDGETSGPFTTAELRRQLTRGDLAASDQVRTEGTEDWRSPADCAELSAVPPAGQRAARDERFWNILPWVCGVAAVALFALWQALPGPGTPDVAPLTPAAASADVPTEEIADAAPRLHQPPSVTMADRALAGFPAGGKGNDESPANQEKGSATLSDAVTVRKPLVTAQSQAADRPVAERREAAGTFGTAYTGVPLGVAEVRMVFAEGQLPRIPSDTPLFVVAGESRLYYPAFEIEYAEEESHQARALTARFLFQGDEPRTISVAAGGKQLGEAAQIVPQQNAPQAYHARHRWWRSYTRPLNFATPEERRMRHYLADSLARRLDLPAPYFPRSASDSSSAVERQFERAVGMLFGFDSVTLAMQTEEEPRPLDRTEAVIHALPPPLRMRSVVTPTSNLAKVNVESIANYVPAECFYVRCGNLENYFWLRNLLMDWGGDLQQPVSTTTLDRHTRQRIEQQLAIDPHLAEQEGLDHHLRDLALIGCDTLFRNGAALGVLIEAHDLAAVKQIVESQRLAIKRRDGGLFEQTVRIGDSEAHLLSAPDNHVRSFLLVDGNHLLITNSSYIARRFVRICDQHRQRTAVGSLGALAEFRYARLKFTNADEQQAFIYLSDPFFRHIISPHYRIEMGRRAQAANDLQQLRIACIAAKAEGAPAETLPDLIAGKFLPANFASRPDGSAPVFHQGHVVDSLRGAPVTFLPVPDVPVGKVTNSELLAYRSFGNGYRKQWRLMDPVSVNLARELLPQGRQQVKVDIHVTPYAAEHYAPFRQHLSPDRQRAIVPHEDDLLSMETSLRSQGSDRSLYAGLRDQAVDFQLTNGQLQTTDLAGGTFGRSRFYLAMNPGSTDALVEAAQILGMGTTAAHKARRELPLWVVRVDPWVMAVSGAFVMSDELIAGMRALIAARQIEVRDDRLVWACDPQLRESVFDTMRDEPNPFRPMLSFRLREVQQASVYPYIRAYCYLESRRASAENAALLNAVSQQLALPPEQAPAVAEFLCLARPVCPLQGEYRTEPALHGPDLWTSAAWTSPSLYDETATPAGYRFPLLEWLRGMEVQFAIDANTLRAHVEMLVEPSAIQKP